MAVFLAYLLGSFPSALLVGRHFGQDLRQKGSGNLGATNALRVLGWRAGLVVFVADCGKGLLAVLLAGFLYPESAWLVAFALWLAVSGHIWPLWTRFQGGKGVATAAGGMLLLAPMETVLCVLFFVVVVKWRGYVSLASLAALLSLPLIFALEFVLGMPFRESTFYLSLALLPLIFWTHRDNLRRLRQGQEKSWRA